MEWLFVFFAIGLFVFVVPIISLVRLSRLSERVDKLSRQVDGLRAELHQYGEKKPREIVPRTAHEETLIVHIDEAGPQSMDLTETAELAPRAEVAAHIANGEERKSGEAPTPSPSTKAPGQQIDSGKTEPSTGEEKSWEETLASSWMIWLGAITVALAAVFLFRFAIDEGWLTPLTRVILGLGLGGILLGAGERSQRAPLAMTATVVNPDYVPPALSAAGIFAVFVSVFAAHGLYGLTGPTSAFIALAMTAYAALALSLRQGWFVALLGILAGYLVPALINAPEPNAPATFLYLFVLSLGALALMIWRQWRWFSVLTIVGALVWPYLWSLGSRLQVDQLVLGLYLLGLSASFAALSVRLPLFEPRLTLLKWIIAALRQSAGIGFALCGAMLIHIALIVGFNAGSFVFLVLYAALALGLGIWRQSLESLIALAALVALAALLLWPQPAAVSAPARLQELGVPSAKTALGPYVMPPEFYAFSRALWAFAAVFGLGGFLSVFQVRAKALWAGLSSLLPVLLFAIGYWRIADFKIDIDWATWAIGLSIVLLLGTIVVGRRLRPDQRDVPLALYAAGVTAAISLAFACLLREAWLSVALAAEVAALSWIWSRLRVRELRLIATVVLAVVAIRLVINPMVLDYRGSVLGMFGWVIYGYGLPAMLTVLAARTFAKGGRDTVVALCEIAATGFGFLLVSLQLRLWTSGTLDASEWDLLDGSVQAIWWIVASMLLLRRHFTAMRPWASAAGRGMLAASGLLIVFGSLLSNNPALVHEWVGPLPLLNLISLAYLVPGLLYAVCATGSRLDLPKDLRRVLNLGAGVLLFIDLTLEVRHAFWGSYMNISVQTLPSNAETYAYSAAWILFALAVLAAAILRHSQALRYASLAVLLATVVKVFLYDMSDLTGLYRVASFLGLGLTLLAIGRIYRVFVFRSPEPAAAGENSKEPIHP